MNYASAVEQNYVRSDHMEVSLREKELWKYVLKENLEKEGDLDGGDMNEVEKCD